MKKLLLTSIIVLLTCFVFAQSWNPYLSQGIISPAPLSTVESDGVGVVSFNVGNTGSSTLNLDRSNPDSNLVLVISLSNGVPNVEPLNKKSALKAISGSWADMFRWEYDMTLNTIRGIQIQPILGLSQGDVVIQYKITRNSPLDQPRNGFSVILVPPGYTVLTNSTNDDEVSSYTWTKPGE
jgi:hypothetical protein